LLLAFGSLGLGALSCFGAAAGLGAGAGFDSARDGLGFGELSRFGSAAFAGFGVEVFAGFGAAAFAGFGSLAGFGAGAGFALAFGALSLRALALGSLGLGAASCFGSAAGLGAGRLAFEVGFAAFSLVALARVVVFGAGFGPDFVAARLWLGRASLGWVGAGWATLLCEDAGCAAFARLFVAGRFSSLAAGAA
jgi:hypothetical protein